MMLSKANTKRFILRYTKLKPHNTHYYSSINNNIHNNNTYPNKILINKKSFFCTQTQEISKIEQLVEDISQLNLKEISEFTQLLKSKLNLPDSSLMMGNISNISTTQQISSDDTEDSSPKG